MAGELTFAAPGTLAGALTELRREGAVAVGGGTSVAMLLRARMIEARRLVYLGHVPELAGCWERRNGEIRIGGTVRLRELQRSPLIRSRLPALAAAADQVGNARVRAVATVGGALAHADPRQDLPPVLLALGTRVTVAGPAGTRTVPLDGFLHGLMETDLADGELVTDIVIPADPARRASYQRFTPGSAEDFPAVGVAAAVSLADDGSVSTARIALGGVASAAFLAAAAAAELAGRPLTAETIAVAAASAAAAAEPWADRHGSAEYKREMTEIWTRRALESCAAG